jgi:hypothetical protein
VPVTPVSAGLAEASGLLAAVPAVPEPPPADRPWLAQSLSKGTAGIALLHIERAHAGLDTWQRAHSWIAGAVAGPVSSGPGTGLYLGLPAVSLMLAAASGGGRYQAALAGTGRHAGRLAHARAEAGLARIRDGRPAVFREYDVFFGLTGLGALLLRCDPGGSALEHVLRYLVALTRPLRVGGTEVPGWWVSHDPSRRDSPGFPGGHGNLGAAHGISGPLALFGHAARRGVTVDGQQEAIAVILGWLSAWRQESAAGPWWPEWITMADLLARSPSQRQPNRPSWCYGTPGIARAGQIGAIAVGDEHGRREYEDALARCLADPGQQAKITDAGLCHGAAGLYMTALRAAGDAASPAVAGYLPDLAGLLRHWALAESAWAPGFLEGNAGTALALHAAAAGAAPDSGWDACMLIS